MSDGQKSGLHVCGIGIVVEAKERGSDYAKIYPIEDIPLIEGLLKDKSKKIDVKGLNAKGLQISSKITSESSVISKWISWGDGNRITAPDVQPGETVLMLRFGDVGEYYWTDIFREPSLRRQETVLYSWGNIPKGIKAYDKSSSYWYEVSTHDKYMHWHTSTNDGEKFSYDFKIDTKNATVKLGDDAGNQFILDSSGNLLALVNAKGSFLKADEETASINGSKTVTIDAVDTVTLTATETIVNGPISTKGGVDTPRVKLENYDLGDKIRDIERRLTNGGH